MNSGDKRYDTKMLDPDFTVAFALRLSLEPFADVNRDYMCKRCGDLMGISYSVQEIWLSRTHGAPRRAQARVC